jgi:hypothetical protein
MKDHIRPVAKANDIHKRIGWQAFRHTFGTLLKANGEDVKTVQELLRHANSRITLEVYTQAVTSHKRAAESKIVRIWFQIWVRGRMSRALNFGGQMPIAPISNLRPLHFSGSHRP